MGCGFLAGAASGVLSSIASSVWQGDLKTETGFFKENNWAYGSRVTGSFAGVGGRGTAGMIAFGTVMGGAGPRWLGFLNGEIARNCIPCPQSKACKTNYLVIL